VRSHQSRVEGQNHLPRPAGHAAFDAAQDTVGCLGCERTLLAHVQLFIQQYPRVLGMAAFNPFVSQPVLITGVASTHVQDLTLGLSGSYRPISQVCPGPCGWHRVLLVCQLHHSAWCQSADLLKVHLILLSKSLMKMLNSTRSQYGSLRDTTCHQRSFGHQAVGCCDLPTNSLSTEQSTHQMHISPIKREGCHGGLCQRLYRSPDRSHP